MLKPEMIYQIFVHFHWAMRVQAWPCKDKKIPPPNEEEELMMEADF